MIRPSRIGERGGSKLNTVLTLAVLAAMIFAGVEIVPAYIAKYQLQDAIETESKFALASYPKKSIEDIREDVWKKVQDLDIPARRDAIRVNVSEGNVEIGLDYAVPVNLLVYQFTLDFHPHADNHSI